LTTNQFRLLSEADTPTVIGKAWWNEALKLAKAGDARRTMMVVFGTVAAAAVVPAVAGNVFAGIVGDDTKTTQMDALELQRKHGWSFGVANEASSLRIAGGVPDPAIKPALKLMASGLAPTNPAHVPAYVPTLFQSLSESPAPASPPTEDQKAAAPVQLVDVIFPMESLEMDAGTTDARWLRSLLKSRVAGVAIVVDLPGPAAVAFAAELADAFDPVFLFDNWPHPRGVVPAHLTLAATAGRLGRFAQMRDVRSTSAPPLFVLDRNRLAPYTDERSQFDNRSLSRLPGADLLKKAGVNRVLYVAPNNATPITLDDVNEDLLAYATAGINVRAIQLGEYYQGSIERGIEQFTARYGFPSTPAPPPAPATPSSSWTPQPRTTPFAAADHSHGHVRPTNFGMTPVILAAGTGVVLGSVLYRSGSWNRTTSSYGGG
jgi:hypothetical protein